VAPVNPSTTSFGRKIYLRPLQEGIIILKLGTEATSVSETKHFAEGQNKYILCQRHDNFIIAPKSSRLDLLRAESATSLLLG